MCLRKLNPPQLDKSITILKEAVEMQSDNPEAHNNLGQSYFEAKDFNEALNSYIKAIQNSQHEKTHDP